MARQEGELQRVVYEVAEAAATVADLQALFRRIHEIVGSLLPARNLYIALYDGPRDALSFPCFVDEHDTAPGPGSGSGVFSGDAVEAVEGFIVDVTDRMRSEAEREALEGRLGQAQKMETVGRLAGGVAHDLNNLRVPILGYVDLLLGDAECGTGAAEMLGHILSAAERARDLARRLLAFSRKQILELRTVDLASVVKGFLDLIRRTIREDITLSVELPPAPAPVPVSADVAQIEQVIMNLVLNA